MTGRDLTLLLVLSLPLAACGGPASYQASGTNVAAGADATIEVEELDGNAFVRLDATHLPPPQRLGEGLTVYVLWFESEGEPAEKVSVLDYDEEERSGSARASTMQENILIMVTAERSPAVATPSEHLIFKKRVTIDQ
ncbi:MAG: hypothetical protein ACOCXM_08290 [Myxococcota bacterium]